MCWGYLLSWWNARVLYALLAGWLEAFQEHKLRSSLAMCSMSVRVDFTSRNKAQQIVWAVIYREIRYHAICFHCTAPANQSFLFIRGKMSYVTIRPSCEWFTHLRKVWSMMLCCQEKHIEKNAEPRNLPVQLKQFIAQIKSDCFAMNIQFVSITFLARLHACRLMFVCVREKQAEAKGWIKNENARLQPQFQWNRNEQW